MTLPSEQFNNDILPLLFQELSAGDEINTSPDFLGSFSSPLYVLANKALQGEPGISGDISTPLEFQAGSDYLDELETIFLDYVNSLTTGDPMPSNLSDFGFSNEQIDEIFEPIADLLNLNAWDFMILNGTFADTTDRKRTLIGNALSAFLATKTTDDLTDYAASSASNVFGVFYVDFIEQMFQTSMLLEQGSISPTGTIVDLLDPLATPTLNGYKNLYGFFTIGIDNAPTFEDAFLEFYNTKVSENGYFLPSHFASEWVNIIRKQNPILSGDLSVLETGSAQLAVIFRIFELISDTITSLQNVAVAQADRLRFYAAYQKSYTNMLTELPVINNNFYNPDGVIEKINPEDVPTIVGQMQALVESWSEKARGRRGVIEDESESHQQTVNQSNEVVNQIQSLASEILTQLSTLISAITKG